MFDVNAVQRIADEMEFYELVIFLEEEKAKYVKFILNGNEDLIIGSLRQAIKLDSSLKTKALKDPEFANYNIASKL